MRKIIFASFFVVLFCGFVSAGTDGMKVAIMDLSGAELMRTEMINARLFTALEKEPANELDPETIRSLINSKQAERDRLSSLASLRPLTVASLIGTLCSAGVGIYGLVSYNNYKSLADAAYADYLAATDQTTAVNLHNKIDGYVASGNTAGTIGSSGFYSTAGFGAICLVTALIDLSRKQKSVRLKREIDDLKGRLSFGTDGLRIMTAFVVRY